MSDVAFVAELDHAELTVRLLEVGLGLNRPKGMNANEIMASVWDEAEGKSVNQKALSDFERMATVAIEYLVERVASGGRPQ